MTILHTGSDFHEERWLLSAAGNWPSNSDAYAKKNTHSISFLDELVTAEYIHFSHYVDSLWNYRCHEQEFTWLVLPLPSRLASVIQEIHNVTTLQHNVQFSKIKCDVLTTTVQAIKCNTSVILNWQYSLIFS